MSLQLIRNGLFTLFTASGPYLASEVSTCDFGIIGNVSASAIVLMPGPNSYIEPLADGFTRDKRKYWDIAGRGYIKFDGDATDLLSRTWQMHDDIYNTVNKDDSLQGTATAAMVKSFNFNPDVAVDAAGALWGVINFRIVAEEF